MPLDPNRVQAVFGAVLECDADGDRAAVLDSECSTDLELRRRVEALLAAHDRSDILLDRPIVRTSDRDDLPRTIPDHEGREGTKSEETVGVTDGSSPTIGLNLDANPSRGLPAIPGYEILDELGRGGMGVVYRARQIRLGRPCALKMILGGAHARPEVSARFLAEARAIAQIQHPHIVQIHHIGEADGLPFIELEYIDGGSLDRRLDGTPWPARRASGLVELLADAMAEAHRLGIVHRDLKPGNIMLTADGSPKITDFGLAKSLGEDSGLTATDSIMGSPSYMAPEQAAGRTKQLGTPADIYALGAILYELLTGRPPFRGATLLETLEQVKATEPVPPSRLVPGLPRDVETIALKCLQKEPGKRYDSAATLAEDIRRFLDGEPIVARPVPFWERSWRWCRRHPAPAVLTAAIVLVTVLGLAGILWQWEEAVKARDLASRRAVAETQAHRKLETTLVDIYTTSGIAAGDQGENARASLWFAKAAQLAENDPDRRLANAVRARTWGRRAFTPLRAVVSEESWHGGLVLHPTGRHLITSDVIDGFSRIARCTLWDMESEQPLAFPGGVATATAAAWSPDGKALAVGLKGGDVIVAGFPEDDRPMRIPFPPTIRSLAFSRDGRHLAIAGGRSARVWDIRSRTFATPELVHPSVVFTVSLDPSGRFLATGCFDNQARLFAVSGGATSPLWPPVPHVQAAFAGTWERRFDSPPLFVDGGRSLITRGPKADLTWHDAETGAEVQTLGFPELIRGIASIELSGDGRYLAVLGFQIPRVQLVEAAKGRRVGRALDHNNTVLTAAFSPDSRTLLTGSTDNTARLWSVPGGESLARPLDLHRPVKDVAFAPGGRSLATQDGNLVRLWAFPEEGLARVRLRLDGNKSFAAISPDGVVAIPTGMTFPPNALRSTRAYHVATGGPAGPTLRPGGRIVDAAFSPDGRSVVTAEVRIGGSSGGQDLVAWDWSSGREVWRASLPSDPRSLAYRPDGRRLAVLCGDGALLVFDAETGREALRWRAHDTEPAHHWVNNGDVGFSRDGRTVLTWGMGNDLRVWDADTGRPRYSPVSHRDKCHDVQLSPDGRLMATASYDGSVRVRELMTGTVVAELPAHPDMVYSAGFSPDGKSLVTACRDRTVRVWDWRAGRLACPPFEHGEDAVAATFTPDGRWVISTGADKTARVWDWRTGKPVTPSLEMRGLSWSVVVTPDGGHAIVGGLVDELALLDLSTLSALDSDPDVLRTRAELLSGQQLHDGGGMVNLSADEWIERWRAFRRRSPVADIGTAQIDRNSFPSDESALPETKVEPREEVKEEDIVNRFDLADASLGARRVDVAMATGRELVPPLRRLVELHPDDPHLRHRFALALVLAGDREGYRRASVATLEHFGRSEDAQVGEAGRACLVGIDTVGEPSVPRRLIKKALAQDPDAPWLRYVLGLADYREGRYEDAVQHLGESLKLGGWAASALNEPVLAMAHLRLGHRDESGRWLSTAHGRRDGSTDGGEPRGGLGTAVVWWDRVEFQLLLREADAITLDADFPADPFAR